MKNAKYTRTRELLEAELGEQMVALDVHAGQCFGFNEVAATVWRLIEQPKTCSELKEALLDAYEVDRDRCEIELRQLLEDLVSVGLVRVEPSGAGTDA